MHLSDQELLEVKEILQRLTPQFEVRAFGSRVHGEHLRQFSDLDLVIMTDEIQPIEFISKLKDAFSNSDLPFKVDVLDWSAVDESFRKIIADQYEVIFALTNPKAE